MIDDPFALLAYGILLLAGGMYPIGFLFGACSACCDECEPCNRCNHGSTGDPDEGTCNVEVGYAYQINNGSQVSGTRSPGSEDVENAPTAIDSTTIPCNNRTFRLAAKLTGLFGEQSTDNCNCPACCNFILTFRVFDTTAQDDFDIATPITLEFCECSETTANVTVNILDIAILMTAGNFAEQCPAAYEEFLAHAAVSTLSVELDINACECGACCTDEQCEPSTTEFYCEDAGTWFNKSAGVWQGVGTDCDPNPCE